MSAAGGYGATNHKKLSVSLDFLGLATVATYLYKRLRIELVLGNQVDRIANAPRLGILGAFLVLTGDVRCQVGYPIATKAERQLPASYAVVCPSNSEFRVAEGLVVFARPEQHQHLVHGRPVSFRVLDGREQDIRGRRCLVPQ